MAEEPTGRTPIRYDETHRTTPWATPAQFQSDFRATVAESERLRIDRDRQIEERRAATDAAVGYVEPPHEVLQRRHQAAIHRAREALVEMENMLSGINLEEPSSTGVRGIVTEERSNFLDRTRRGGFNFRNLNINGVNPR